MVSTCFRCLFNMVRGQFYQPLRISSNSPTSIFRSRNNLNFPLRSERFFSRLSLPPRRIIYALVSPPPPNFIQVFGINYTWILFMWNNFFVVRYNGWSVRDYFTNILVVGEILYGLVFDANWVFFSWKEIRFSLIRRSREYSDEVKEKWKNNGFCDRLHFGLLCNLTRSIITFKSDLASDLKRI